MQELWDGDLDHRGKEVLLRYEQGLSRSGLSSVLGAVYGFFGSGAVLTIMGAAVDGRFLNWRYPAVIVAATISGYLVGRYFEDRDSAHRRAIINALHGSGMRGDIPR